MSAVSEILGRLSGIALLRDRLAETSRHVDRSLARLLDHGKRLVHLEATQARLPPGASAAARPRLQKKPDA
ncbi:MAG: hypothetical protein EPO12_17780 [Aquabacterium sp.]|jgi:hypothetical protein|nr:MAG: hypothetical protein EPO12_17780 [Aquabacterium sp.]